jgi:hypothetical protein
VNREVPLPTERAMATIHRNYGGVPEGRFRGGWAPVVQDTTFGAGVLGGGRRTFVRNETAISPVPKFVEARV